MRRGNEGGVLDIVAAIGDIRADTAGMDFAGFEASPTVGRSVLFSIAVMGEAARKIDPGFKATYPHMPVIRTCLSDTPIYWHREVKKNARKSRFLRE